MKALLFFGSVSFKLIAAYHPQWIETFYSLSLSTFQPLKKSNIARIRNIYTSNLNYTRKTIKYMFFLDCISEVVSDNIYSGLAGMCLKQG